MTAVDSFVGAVEAEMRAAIARTPVAAPALRLLAAGGKRLRARLLWWAANASAARPLPPDDPALVRAATAIEFAHLGSLIHDDIVDGGDTRRGVATLHRERGLRVATDAGTALAHLASALVADLGRTARRAVRRALLATCRGQIRELAVPFVLLPPRRRLAIMQEKTGAFFELAAALGATLAGAPPVARAAVCRYARRYGVAFQIADDVLDLAGDPRELGRANGADLRDGVMTLPVLLGVDPAGELARHLQRLRRDSDSATVAACAAVVAGGGGLTTATTVARWWLARALDALRVLPPGSGVNELVALATDSVERGLRRATPSFEAAAGSLVPDRTAATTLIESPMNYRVPSMILHASLVGVLEWFHPGLSTMVATRMQDPRARATRVPFRWALLRGAPWSPEAVLAADAMSLAHALADDGALRHDPVRTLALVDALHCAAIGFLAVVPSGGEHRRLATRAAQLQSEGSSPSTVPTYDLPSLLPEPAAPAPA